MSKHVGMRVSAYVDRVLDAATLRELDRHLVACQVCCYAVEEERRLLDSLRHGATPGVSAGLHASLLSLASSASSPLSAGEPPQRPAPGGLGLVEPAAPSLPAPRFAPVPVPTVSPTRPALHRSPRRAAGLAGFAASASAVAAIGLAVAGPGATASPARPAVRPGGTVPVSTETVAYEAPASSAISVGSGLDSARVALDAAPTSAAQGSSAQGSSAQGVGTPGVLRASARVQAATGAAFWTRTTTTR